MALSWLNLPCGPKAAIGYGKRTLAPLASLPRHRGFGKAYCGSGSRSPNTGFMIAGASPAATPTSALRSLACVAGDSDGPKEKPRGRAPGGASLVE
jgi:hypothetical protein